MGLSRRAKDGVAQLEWNEVERVYRLSRAYLFAQEGGTMPVPYRSLSGNRRAALEDLLRSVGHGGERAA